MLWDQILNGFTELLNFPKPGNLAFHFTRLFIGWLIYTDNLVQNQWRDQAGGAGTYVVSAPPLTLNLGSTPALTTNGLNVALQGPAGNYLIEASSDLSSSANWQPIVFYSSTNASFYYNFAIPTATNANQQFYRAMHLVNVNQISLGP